MRRKRKISKLKVAALLVALCGMSTMGVFAAESDETAQEPVAVEESADSSETVANGGTETREVVVSATRREMELKDAPQTITVINREQIEKRKSSTVIDLLRDVPGVEYVNQSGNMVAATSVRVRGSEGNHVLVLVDGKRLSGDPSWYNNRVLEHIRADDVERVEIMKGPAGVQYGSNATGGVINIITRAPMKDSIEVFIKHRALESDGDLGTDLGFYVTGKKRGSFSWTLSAAENYTNKLLLDTESTRYPHGEKIPVNFKGIWDLNKNNKLQFDFRFMKEDMSWGGDGATAATVKNKSDIRTYDYGLNYTGKSAKLEWQVRAYRTDWKKWQDYFNRAHASAQHDGWYQFRIHKAVSDVVEGQLTYRAGSKHSLTVGGEYIKEAIQQDALRGNGAEKYYTYSYRGTSYTLGGLDRENMSFFIQDEWTPSEKWLIIPGARVEYSDSFGSEVIPKIGATYFAKPDLRFKASVGKGYRVPTILELYRETGGNPITTVGNPAFGLPGWMLGNPNLEPERSNSYEVSIEKDWKNHSARVAFFRNDVTNLITNTPSYELGTVGGSPAGVITWVNVNEARMMGVELGTTHKLSKELSGKLGYTYLDAQNAKTKSRLTGRARHQFSVGLDYRPLDGKWLVAVDGMLTGGYVYSVTEERNDFLWNGIVERKFGKDKNATVYIGVENIFDHKDYTFSEFGRTYIMGASYKF